MELVIAMVLVGTAIWASFSIPSLPFLVLAVGVHFLGHPFFVEDQTLQLLLFSCFNYYILQYLKRKI